MDESELIHEVNVAVEEAIRLFNENHPGADREEAKSLIIQIGEVVKEKNYTKALTLAMKAQNVARGASAAATHTDAGIAAGPAVTPSIVLPTPQIPDIDIPGITSPEPGASPAPRWSLQEIAITKKEKVPRQSSPSLSGMKNLPVVEIGLIIVIIVLAVVVWLFLPF